MVRYFILSKSLDALAYTYIVANDWQSFSRVTHSCTILFPISYFWGKRNYSRKCFKWSVMFLYLQYLIRRPQAMWIAVYYFTLISLGVCCWHGYYTRTVSVTKHCFTPPFSIRHLSEDWITISMIPNQHIMFLWNLYETVALQETGAELYFDMHTETLGNHLKTYHNNGWPKQYTF